MKFWKLYNIKTNQNKKNFLEEEKNLNENQNLDNDNSIKEENNSNEQDNSNEQSESNLNEESTSNEQSNLNSNERGESSSNEQDNSSEQSKSNNNEENNNLENTLDATENNNSKNQNSENQESTSQGEELNTSGENSEQQEKQENKQGSEEVESNKQDEIETNKENEKVTEISQSDIEKKNLQNETQSQNEENLENQDIQNKKNLEKEIENLKKLRDKLEEINNLNDIQEEIDNILRKHGLIKEKNFFEEKEKEEKELNTNYELLDMLNEIPKYEERQRGDGYSFNTSQEIEINDLIIKSLINKFLNQRFKKNNTNLNVRTNSLVKTNGFYKWDTNAVVKHLTTKEVTKVLTDKYGYKYDEGKSESVPLSFYFDLSGSMNHYSKLLTTIAIELLKNDIKVLIGFNERVNYQISSINNKVSNKEFEELLIIMGESSMNEPVKTSNAKYVEVNENIDEYLKKSKAEKCVIFSDFDPLYEIKNLSQICDVYWFCFENYRYIEQINGFKGFIYQTKNEEDIVKALKKINNNKFETLCYMQEERKIK